ncbi:MAG: hypothetical protein IJV71_02630 [Lachnospiraceae bacterium]|nr:hypothetical protein [Lachnospiraceae bacterium]
MITYQVNMDDLREIEQYLAMTRDKSKLVLRSAINDTAKDTMTLLLNETAKRYLLKRSYIKKTMGLSKATTGHLSAVIAVTSPTTELYDSKVSPRKYVHPLDFANKPKVYKGKVLRASPLSKLVLKPGSARDKYKAFVAKYQSGHITIAQRVPGKRMKSKPQKEFVKTLLSPSVPTMMGNEKGVFGVVQPQMHDMLVKHIASRIERHLG